VCTMSTTIAGVEYTTALLKEAKQAATDGQISKPEAGKLWQLVVSRGSNLSGRDKMTLNYILTHEKCTQAAEKFLKAKMGGKPIGNVKQMKGVKYERELFEQAEAAGKAGGITKAVAEKLYADALDANVITEVERRTLVYALENIKIAPEAAEFLKIKLYGTAKEESCFLEIDGVKYERELFEDAEKYAADGGVSLDQARLLWEKVLEGTDCAKKTLQYAMNKFTFTDGAAIYLIARLQQDGMPAGPAVTVSDKIKTAVEQQLQNEKREDLETMQEYAAELKEEFTKAFKDMDKDGDGSVTPDELKNFVATKDSAIEVKLGIGSWDDFVAKADADGDGKITQDEFVNYAVNLKIDIEMLAGVLFDAMDANCDNVVSFDEVKDYEWLRNPHIFQVLGFDDFRTMVASIDADKNEKIEREEFIKFFMEKEKKGNAPAFKRRRMD